MLSVPLLLLLLLVSDLLICTHTYAPGAVGADANRACHGNLGPDYFNFSSFASQESMLHLGDTVLQEQAKDLTSAQEQWLSIICRSGFHFQDCRTRAGDDDLDLNTACQGGSGYIYVDSRSLLDGHISCCEPSFWEKLRMEDWPKFVLDELIRSEVDTGLALANKFYDGQPPTAESLQRCLACNFLYKMVQEISFVSERHAHSEFIRIAALNGMVPTNHHVQFYETTKHYRIVCEILQALEEQFASAGVHHIQAAEVGVYQGDISHFCLGQMDNLSMLMVDPYQETFESGDNYTELYLSNPMEDLVRLRRRVAKYVDMGRASIMVSPSTTAASWVADKSLAFVFLDGDHEESAVRRDIQAWAPKVVPGGIIAGHDYDPFSEWGVRDVDSVTETSPRRVGPVDGVWRAHGVAAAVNAALPPGRTLHLAPATIWWWQVSPEDVEHPY